MQDHSGAKAGFNIRNHVGLAFLAGLLIAGIAFSIWTLQRQSAPPEIQGVLLSDARALPAFQLTDHHTEPFSNAELQGSWHLLTYGFTHCPDICPSMLAAMSSMVRELEASDSPWTDVDLLFYSVDPARDTPEHLADYVTFFHNDLTGLTVNGDTVDSAERFERGLGIVYEIPTEDRFGTPYGEDDYPVNHGVKIFLLNPDGRLQAVFDPGFTEDGMVHYSIRQLIQDYEAVRRHLADT